MIEIIPAIDIIEGKCVRLQKGDYDLKTVYKKNPLDVAREFEDSGIRRLHLVDLDGAKEKHVVNYKTLEKIAGATKLKIDFGGGIKSDEDIKIVFECGAEFATIGSVAVTDKILFLNWLKKYGENRIILGADIRNGNIAISGWMDVTNVSLQTFLQNYSEEGVKYILCTDISKDGMLQGASVELYKKLTLDFSKLNIIASGGITSINEIDELNQAGVYGVIIGKAYYEGLIKLKDLKRFL